MGAIEKGSEANYDAIERVRASYPAHMTVKQKQDFHFGRALLGIYSGTDVKSFKDDLDAISLADKHRLMRIAATMGCLDVFKYIKECSPRTDTSEALIQAASAEQDAVIAEIFPKKFDTVKARRAMRAAAANGHEKQIRMLERAVHIVTLEQEMKDAGDMDGLMLIYKAIGDVDAAMKIDSIITKKNLSAAVDDELKDGPKRRRM